MAQKDIRHLIIWFVEISVAVSECYIHFIKNISPTAMNIANYRKVALVLAFI